MSFYTSQFNNKSSRYCSSNLYGSNLSTVYADGPPPLDDTLEEDDGEIVFRDKNPTKDSSDSKLDSDKSSTVSGDLNPWCKNDQKDVADDDFGDFSGFADFSSAFGGNSKSQNDSSWFKNGDNDQSSVTNFNHNFPNHQGKISSSSRKTVEKKEGKTSKDDDFGCFSEEDSDFDNFCSFTSNNQNTEKAEENGSKDSQVSEDYKSKKTTNSDELFKNDKTIHGSNYSLAQNAKNSNFGSADDFNEFGSFEGGPTLNGSSTSPTNNSSTSHAQTITSDTHSAMKPTCFSDDDDDFGDFSSSSFDDERGETSKSPDLIINPQQANFSLQPKANEIQNIDMNESSSIERSQVIKSEHNPKESKDSDETVQLPQYNGSETSTEKNGEDINISDEDNDLTNTDQSKENNDDEFGEFSASDSSVTKTEVIKSKDLSSINNINDDADDFGEFGVQSPPCPPSLHDDDDFGEFGAVTASTIENEKKDNDEDDDLGDLGAASPPSLPSPHGNSDNDDDEFGDFGSTAMPTSSTEDETAFPTKRSDLHSNSDNEFGDFGVAVSSSTEEKPKGDANDEFGKFGSVLPTAKNDHQDNATTTATADDDDEFGDFGLAPATNKPNFQSNKGAAAAVDDDDDEFGEFGSAPTTTKHDHHDNTAATVDDDDFGDFGSATAASRENLHDNNDDDDFGDFGVTSPPTSKQNKDNDFGDFAEVEQPSSKESKPKSTSEPSSLEPKMPPPNDDDDEFGQFDSAPSKPSDSGFADFKSADNTSEGFEDFSSMPQKSMSSSFSTTKDSQSFSNKDFQQQPSKVTGNTCVIKPQRSTNPDILENAIKDCFSSKDVTIESHIIIQKIEHEVKSERSSTWQQLLTTEKDGSLRFNWVLSEHQVKMLDGLLMVPVKIQTSVSFKPKGQVPPPLFASSMGLLEPVKGVITPFHHIEEINPSQDPFGAPPEVGVQDLGFGKESKKETPTLPTESKDHSKSDTVSVSSSLDLDFLAPSTTNGESTKTESRGLFEDDLLGLGMFSEPSPSPKITNGKNTFKFNNTTIPLATNEGNLSEQAKTVIKDFEDLSFMLSKVLMFPLKSKE